MEDPQSKDRHSVAPNAKEKSLLWRNIRAEAKRKNASPLLHLMECEHPTQDNHEACSIEVLLWTLLYVRLSDPIWCYPPWPHEDNLDLAVRTGSFAMYKTCCSTRKHQVYHMRIRATKTESAKTKSSRLRILWKWKTAIFPVFEILVIMYPIAAFSNSFDSITLESSISMVCQKTSLADITREWTKSSILKCNHCWPSRLQEYHYCRATVHRPTTGLHPTYCICQSGKSTFDL